MCTIIFGDAIAGIQRRITGPSPTGRSPVTCHSCHVGKQTRAPFRAQPRRPDFLPLAAVSSDTAGPIRPLSADGALHFGTLVAKATRFRPWQALPRKSDAAQFVHDGRTRLQLITGRTIGRYHSNGARELMMPTLVSILRAPGTETTITAAHSPASNPDPEGKNRAIFNAVRTALTTSGIDHRYWTYAAADAVDKLNFIPQRQPDGQYRPSIITLGAPDLPTTPMHLLPFGQRGYLTSTVATKRTLAPRALPARYPTAPSQHQYQVLLPNDTVCLVRASEFIPITGDGSAPATVPPANVPKSHA
jgi:hypothetical protein